MRVLSSFSHLDVIETADTVIVAIDDEALPAAGHLTGPGSVALLQQVVAMAGGELVQARPVHVVYRPRSDLVVRYGASVRWAGAAATDETLIASTNVGAPKPGTLLATADHEGRTLEVSVWRWPFDPIVTGLADVVRPSSVATLCVGLLDAPVRLDVRAYRPTERAVVHVIGTDGREVFMKAVAPTRAVALADLHRSLRAAGVPVPDVLRVLRVEGAIVMQSLAGPTLRDLLKWGRGRWPDVEQYRRIGRALAAAEPPTAGDGRRAGRADDALLHGAMLSAVLPAERHRIDVVLEPIHALAARSAERVTTILHGDLYESQIVVDGAGRIVGLLDVDDLRRGDPIDDRATVLAHLMVRAIAAGAHRAAIERYATVLRDGFAADSDRRELDLTTAAVIVGLATGPFRMHQRHWQRATRRHLELAARVVRGAGERTLRFAS